MLELKGGFEAGTWKYNISVSREDVEKTAVIVVHLNVKNGITVQGFLDDEATFSSVKGNQSKAVKAYAFLNNFEPQGNLSNLTSLGIRCTTWYPNSSDESNDFILRDDGLTSKFLTS